MWVRPEPGSTWLQRRKCYPSTSKSCSQIRSCSGKSSQLITEQKYCFLLIQFVVSLILFSLGPLTGSCTNLMHSCSARKKGSSFCSICSLSTPWTTSALHASSPQSVSRASFNSRIFFLLCCIITTTTLTSFLLTRIKSVPAKRPSLQTSKRKHET